MSANTSTAVVQRRIEPADSLDDFPTPPWAVRALTERLDILPCDWVWEPTCNRGHMVRGLGDAFDARIVASDIAVYDAWHGGAIEPQYADFLFRGSEAAACRDAWDEVADRPFLVPEWIIANPPFRLAAEFVARCRVLGSGRGFALFLRSAFAEGQDRYDSLFSIDPPARILQFSERVVLHKGVLRDPDLLCWQLIKGEWVFKKPATATAYAWFIWEAAPVAECVFEWIAPCRTRLTHPGDYPPLPPSLQARPDLPLFEEAAE